MGSAICPFVVALLVSAAPATPADSVVVVTDDRLALDLVAAEPDIVTPTGLAVDDRGRVWVVENNTHQRETTYKGPATDRIKVFSDFDADGKARRVVTFADGFRNSMSLALGRDGDVYLATRSEIVLLRPKQAPGELIQELPPVERRSLVRLDTTASYPHNGLSGLAFDGHGTMYFGIGENFGAAYTMTGSDGTTIQGSDEGGVFSCRPDGSNLTRVASGFWNPFAQCVDGFGRLFAVDNDPDARGPCRLLHVVRGGDYGFRFRFGRQGTHPFQSWNGELPGTLGMVAGTGEAPSGVVAYESDTFPADYRGDLLVTSWGDHLIERFRLEPAGPTFRSRSKTVVRGGANFRPVAIAVGPDGAVYFSDWVSKSYPVHGKGRIWRLRAKTPPGAERPSPTEVRRMTPGRAEPFLAHPRRDLRDAATDALGNFGDLGNTVAARVVMTSKDPRAKVHALWALRTEAFHMPLTAAALRNSTPEVRAEAIRVVPVGLWVELGGASNDTLLKLAREDPSPGVRFQAVLRLSEPASLQRVVPLLADREPFFVSAAVTALGKPGNSALLLPSVGAGDPRLRLGTLLALRRTGDVEGRASLKTFLDDPDPDVRRAAIQWVGEEKLAEFAPQLGPAAAREPVTPALFRALLAANHLLAGGKPAAPPVDEAYLLKAVADAKQPPAFRVLALRMLRPDSPGLTADLLNSLLTGTDDAVRRQAVRTLVVRSDKAAQNLLLQLSRNPDTPVAVRAEAIAGLGHSAGSAEVKPVLLTFLADPDLRRDALRSLRAAKGDPDLGPAILKRLEKASLSDAERPELDAQLSKIIDPGKQPVRSPAEWRTVLSGPADPRAGERLFFHPGGPRCYACHQIDGRGGNVGPDLSAVGAALSRDRLIESVLEPSKEIAPLFVTWSVATSDGKLHTGVIVAEGADSSVRIADAQGVIKTLRRQDIEERVALPTSLMPENLAGQMTPQEFRDLIAFLAARK